MAEIMDRRYACCCGGDVHKRSIVACLLSTDTQGKRQKETRTFSTHTQALLDLSDWLQGAGCTHVAMESTGVYWRPLYNVLEGQFDLLVVNAQHIKMVPGRKTDVQDAEWIAELLQHGLLTSSFIPSASQREVRELTRYRTTLVEERSRAVNRLQKTLTASSLKLETVVTDITGKSARAILTALLEGQSDPTTLAELAKGRLRKKLPELRQALAGSLTEHHRFLLSHQLTPIDDLDEAIGQVAQEIERRLSPVAAELTRLDTIPGVAREAAEGIVAELGTDMTRFPTAKHLASWLGLCPGNHQSGGKQHSGKTRQGNRWLRQLLIQVAHAAAHTKQTYLAAQYRRLAARRGKKKAIVAVAHSILVIIYQLLRSGKTSEDLGSNYFDERDRQGVQKRLVQRLEQLGLAVTVQPLPKPAEAGGS